MLGDYLQNNLNKSPNNLKKKKKQTTYYTSSFYQLEINYLRSLSS